MGFLNSFFFLNLVFKNSKFKFFAKKLIYDIHMRANININTCAFMLMYQIY